MPLVHCSGGVKTNESNIVAALNSGSGLRMCHKGGLAANGFFTDPFAE